MSDTFRYEIILYWSKDDQAFIAEVPELPGCAADGTTYQELRRMSRSSHANGSKERIELGRTIPEPRGRLMFA